MTSLELPYLQIIQARGKRYAYYRRGGRRFAIAGEIGSPAWLAEYGRIHTAHEMEKQQPEKEVIPGSLSDLITCFKASGDWRNLADQTKSSYDRILADLNDWKGRSRVATIPREFAIKIQDRYVDTPRKADYAVAIVRRLLTFAVERPSRFGLKTNPLVRISKTARSTAYPAWPRQLIEALLSPKSTCSPEVQLAIRLGLDTGQRIGDCIAMTWAHYQRGQISVAQEKTGSRLTIQATWELAGALEHTERRAATILTTPSGRPWNRHALARAIKEAVEAAGYPGHSYHGLRKSAAARLAEAGCTDHEIMAVTGHKTMAMVQHYTESARQETMAKSAVGKLNKTAQKRPSGKHLRGEL